MQATGTTSIDLGPLYQAANTQNCPLQRSLWKSASTPFSDSRTTISGNNLVIDVTSSYTLTFYVKTDIVTNDGVIGTGTLMQLEIYVCSNAIYTDAGLTLAQRGYYFTLSTGFMFITTSQIATWYMTSSLVACPIDIQDVYFDSAGTQPNNLNNIFWQKSAQEVRIRVSAQFNIQPLYLYIKTKTGFTSAILFNVEVCGAETVASTNTVPATFTLVKQAGGVHRILATTISSWFTLALPTTDSLCGFKTQKMYTTSGGPTLFVYADIIWDLTSAQSLGFNDIKIDLSNGFAQKIFYVVGTTPSVSNYKQVNVEVCGFEQIAVIDPTPLKYVLVKTGASYSITPTTQQSFYQLTNQGVNCITTKYEMCTDSTGTTPFANANIFFQTTASIQLYTYPLQIKQTAIYSANFFLKATTFGGVSAFKEFYIEICEPISLKSTDVPEYKFEYKMSPVEQDVVDVTSFFNGWTAQCSFMFEVNYMVNSVEQLYPLTNIKINTANTLKAHTADGLKPMMLYIKAKDMEGNAITKRVYLIVCGEESILSQPSIVQPITYDFAWVSDQTSYPVDSFADWFSSSIPECPVVDFQLLTSSGATYVAQSSTHKMQISKITKDITVFSDSNIHFDLFLEARSKRPKTSQLRIQVNICGNETVSTSPEDLEVVYQLYSKNGSQMILDGTLWFQSSDSLCPVTKYSFEQLNDTNKFIPFIQPQISVDAGKVYVDTKSPIKATFFVKASTFRGRIARQKVVLTVCGGEFIKLTSEQRIIYYNDETFQTLEYEDIKSSFSSTDSSCPISRYALALSKTSQLTNVLLNNLVQMTENAVGSGVVRVKLDYIKMYNNLKAEEIFYLVASTKSNVMGFQKIILKKLGCEAKQISLKSTGELYFTIDESNQYKIPKSSYVDQFISSDELRCPVVNFLLTLQKGNSKFSSTIGFANINDRGEIRFNFNEINKMGTQKLNFFVVGLNTGQVSAVVPIVVTIIPKSIERNDILRLNNITSVVIKEKNNTLGKTQIHSKNSGEDDDAKFRVKPVDFSGLLVFEFKEPMFDEDKGFNKSTITPENLKLEAYSAYSEEKLAFNWTVVEYKHQKLKLQLTFEHPLQVSENMDLVKRKDFLNINVLDSQLLMYQSKTGLKSFRREQLLKQTSISKQLKQDEASMMLLNNSDNLQSTMNFIIISQMLLNLVMSSSMAILVGALHVLQVISFQTMMNLKYPGNAQFVSTIIISFLNADLLDPQLIFDMFFNFGGEMGLIQITEQQPEYHKFDILANIKEMGFETFNPILNIGGLFMVILFTIVQFVVLIALKIVVFIMKKQQIRKANMEGGKKEQSKWGIKLKNVIKKLRNSLEWSTPIMVVYESIIQLMMAFLLFFIKPRFIAANALSDEDSAFTVFSSYFFGILALLSVTALFLISLRLVFVSQKTLEHPLIKRKYGVLYDELKTSSRMFILYNLVFVYRRSIVCFVYLFIPEAMYFQLIFTLFQNMAIMIYIGHINPFMHPQANFREQINELIIMAITNNLILFTDFVQDEDVKYDVAGWGYLFLIALCILFNVSYLVRAMARQIRLLIKKYSLRYLPKKYQQLKLINLLIIKGQREEENKPVNQPSEDKVKQENKETFQSQIDILKMKPTAREEQKTVRSIIQAIKSKENQTQLKMQAVFKKQREASIRHIRLSFITNGFNFDVADEILFNEEIIKLYYEARNTVFFYNSFNKFLNKQFELHRANPTGAKFKTIDTFYTLNQNHIHAMFIERLQAFLKSNKLKTKTDESSFKEFAKKKIRVKHLEKNCLEVDGTIRSEAYEAEPSKFSFFRVEYLPEFMVAEEMDAIQIDEQEFQRLNNRKQEMKWNLEQFLTILRMTEAERKKEFTTSLMMEKGNQQKQEEVSDVIFHFYELVDAYFQYRESELRKQEEQQLSEIMRLQEQSAEFDLKCRIVGTLSEVKIQDQVITLFKRT